MDTHVVAFLADLKDAERSPFTVATYRQNLRRYLAWCSSQGIAPEGTTGEQVKTYLRGIPNARTRRLHLAGLRRLYAYLEQRGAVAVNPAAGLPLPRIERRAPRVLTDEEERALFAAAKGDLELRVLLRLMRFSGLRVSEVVGHRRQTFDPYTNASVVYESPGLRTCDVDLARLTLDVRGKGRSEDLGYLDAHTRQLIARLLPVRARTDPEAPLFQTKDGRPRGTRWAFRAFQQLCLRAGVGRHLTLHMLRHTFLTRFLEAGGNLRAAQRLARHRDLDNTLIYADFVKDQALRAQFDAHNLDTDGGDGQKEIAFGTSKPSRA